MPLGKIHHVEIDTTVECGKQTLSASTPPFRLCEGLCYPPDGDVTRIKIRRDKTEASRSSEL